MVQARIAILEDSRGKVLAILPEQQLLHLALLNHSYQRALRALAAEQVQKIFLPSLLSQPHLFDKLFTLPILLDHSLRDATSLEVYEPVSGLRFPLDASALQNAQIFRFAVDPQQLDHTSTPLEDDEQAILLAVDRFTSLRIKERLADTLEIPPLPMTAQRIIQLGSNKNADVDDLVPLVEDDPSLAAQVISWASSPYYAAPGQIQSVKDAIVRVLGFDLVMNLALGLSLNRSLRVPKDNKLEVKAYWKQAVCCAMVMELLVKAMPAAKRPGKGMAYLAGLLHNFGYLVLAHVFPPHFSLINRYLECNRNLASQHVEKQVLGVTREQVGSWLLQCWQLPPEVWKGIRYMGHHRYDGEADIFAHLLTVTLGLLAERGIGHCPGPGLDESLIASLGLDLVVCRQQVDELLNNSDHLNTLLAALEQTA
ncbi:HDOD domain-containing protein [Pokkaliibacter sp. CJK22405]|uniref:HDOD domain-containing protein n=1 Tax=Pokkaliibacter sp. CJK22405 TaxID=3384615 RepID=UPI003984EE80